MKFMMRSLIWPLSDALEGCAGLVFDNALLGHYQLCQYSYAKVDILWRCPGGDRVLSSA
jgi:hypothetical protein